MTTHEKFIGREMTMQKFRWATPGGLFILTVMVGSVGYVIDKTVNTVDAKIQTIIDTNQQDRDKFWRQFQTLQAQEQCTRYALESCCQGKANFNC